MKTILVTGASSGFGLAVAQRFLQDGWRAVVCARRKDRLDSLSADFPGKVLPLAFDITDRRATEGALAGLPEPFDQIDVLVNSAGLALGLDVTQRASGDDWDRIIATNCGGLVHVTRQIVEGMVTRKHGTVVNLGSVAGEFPYPGGNVYGASKAFVHQFTQNLNADLIGTGVRACCLEPGLCGGTEFSSVRFGGDNARADAVYSGTIPLTAIDIADTVYWVANRPAHITINVISMMPNCQSFSPLAIKRTDA